jgi:hypothetical protein
LVALKAFILNDGLRDDLFNNGRSRFISMTSVMTVFGEEWDNAE